MDCPDCTALPFHCPLLRLLPVLAPISSLINPSTTSLFKLLSVSMRMPHSVHTYRQFVCCSSKNGQHSIGTPSQMLSTVEFHPLCVKNCEAPDPVFWTFWLKSAALVGFTRNPGKKKKKKNVKQGNSFSFTAGQKTCRANRRGEP